MMVRSLPALILLTVTTSASATNHGNQGTYGYGGTCVPGYDANCGPGGVIVPTPSPTPPPISMPPIGPLTPHPTPMPEGPVISTTRNCQLQIPIECVFPFTYKGLQYTTCTGVDASHGTMWCSKDRQFAGHWRQCIDPCNGKAPVKQIVGGVLAGTVAAAGIGLIAAAVHAKQNQKPLPAPTPAPVVATGTTMPIGQWVIVDPATVGHVGIEVETVPIAGPPVVQQLQRLRRLVETQVDVPVGILVSAPTTATTGVTMGPQEANKRMVLYMVVSLIGICLCGCICSVAAAHMAGFGKKRKNRPGVAPQGEAGYPGAYSQIDER